MAKAECVPPLCLDTLAIEPPKSSSLYTHVTLGFTKSCSRNSCAMWNFGLNLESPSAVFFSSSTYRSKNFLQWVAISAGEYWFRLKHWYMETKCWVAASIMFSKGLLLSKVHSASCRSHGTKDLISPALALSFGEVYWPLVFFFLIIKGVKLVSLLDQPGLFLYQDCKCLCKTLHCCLMSLPGKTRQHMKQRVASKVCSHTQIHAMQPVNHKSLQCDTRNGEQRWHKFAFLQVLPQSLSLWSPSCWQAGVPDVFRCGLTPVATIGSVPACQTKPILVGIPVSSDLYEHTTLHSKAYQLASVSKNWMALIQALDLLGKKRECRQVKLQDIYKKNCWS